MKRFTLLLLMFAAVSVYAQKTPKPNLNKALNSWKEGKLDEAKANINLAATNEKMMTDPKTWYYRGLIYASIDTTSNEAHKALATDAYKTAIESFKKADELNKGKAELFIQDAAGLPMLKSKRRWIWEGGYLKRGAGKYREEDL